MAWATDIGQGMIVTFSPVTGGSVDGTLIGVTPPVMSRDMLDITDHGAAHRWRTFLDGLIDAGELVLEVLFDPGQDPQVLLDSAESSLVMTFPPMGYTVASAAWTCNASVSELSVEAPIDDAVKASITCKLTGKPTFTTPS